MVPLVTDYKGLTLNVVAPYADDWPIVSRRHGQPLRLLELEGARVSPAHEKYLLRKIQSEYRAGTRSLITDEGIMQVWNLRLIKIRSRVYVARLSENDDDHNAKTRIICVSVLQVSARSKRGRPIKTILYEDEMSFLDEPAMLDLEQCTSAAVVSNDDGSDLGMVPRWWDRRNYDDEN
jgi:hypothetical protein